MSMDDDIQFGYLDMKEFLDQRTMTILFDIYPAIGHLNASFALADKLLKEKHRVVYCVEAEY